MPGVAIEAALELQASSLRDAKTRMRPLFRQDHVAISAGQFLDGLSGVEHRKTGNRRSWTAVIGMRDALRDNVVAAPVSHARAMAAIVPFSWGAADSVYGVSETEMALRRTNKGYVRVSAPPETMRQTRY